MESPDPAPRPAGKRRPVVLAPTRRADESVRLLLGDLLDALLRNEDGVRRDLHPECLHDYRVALRRTRAVLRELERVFPAAHAAPLAAELRWLGGLTGALRDRDVFRAALAADVRALPPPAAAALQPLHDHLRHERDTALRELTEALAGARYRTLIARWRLFVHGSVPEDARAAPDGARPVRDVAAERLGRAWERVLGRARKAERAEDDIAALHRLRIAAKRLRYLLEVFRSLLPADEVAVLLRPLRRLQDTLGEHHDAAVQEELLLRAARELAARELAGPELLLAAGRLAERLSGRRERAHARFHERIRDLVRASTRRRWTRLLATGTDASAE